MYSISYLNALRRAELVAVLDLFPRGGRVLEIGAGSGQQAAELKAAGFDVEAIDIAGSYLAEHRVFPVTDYDGRTIPFGNRSFDVVFSSNVLEHIADLDAIQREIKRVLRPGGVCVHLVPTHAWRLWTSLAAVPALAKYIAAALAAPSRQNAVNIVRQCGVILLQPRHGEHGHALTELWTFRPASWRSRFARQGFMVANERPGGFFYTGEGIFGLRLGMQRRKALARYLGSSCHVFQLRPE
jgi:2-polyprenyl-3-methyl-5-hydroxy-6-metoxy-1,4-benzoquinol methylase